MKTILHITLALALVSNVALAQNGKSGKQPVKGAKSQGDAHKSEKGQAAPGQNKTKPAPRGTPATPATPAAPTSGETPATPATPTNGNMTIYEPGIPSEQPQKAPEQPSNAKTGTAPSAQPVAIPPAKPASPPPQKGKNPN